MRRGCERDEKHVEDWLAGVGRCKRREERDDMCKGVARWLRHRAATAQIDARRRDERRRAAGRARRLTTTRLDERRRRPRTGVAVAARAEGRRRHQDERRWRVYVGGEEPEGCSDLRLRLRLRAVASNQA